MLQMQIIYVFLAYFNKYLEITSQYIIISK